MARAADYSKARLTASAAQGVFYERSLSQNGRSHYRDSADLVNSHLRGIASRFSIKLLGHDRFAFLGVLGEHKEHVLVLPFKPGFQRLCSLAAAAVLLFR